MAFDLDDDELKSTRKLLGVDKEDNIEKDIEILKNIIKYLNLLIYEGKNKIIYNDLFWDEKTVDCITAIEHLLQDYTRQKQINEEHQKENGLLRERVKELENTIKKISESSSNNEKLIEKFDSGETFTFNQLGFIEKNFIPKQKIKDLKENIILQRVIVGGRRNRRTLEYGVKLGKIKACEELLQEREDK